MSRGYSKSKLKFNFFKINQWVNHIGSTSSKISSLTSDASSQIKKVYNNHYVLDFDAWKFGRIQKDTLSVGVAPDFIELFFTFLQQVEEVSIAVNDYDNPIIENDTRIFVKHGKREIWLFAKVFWAMLSKEMTQPYLKYENYYERLEQLLSDRGISVELEEWTD